MLYSLRKLQKQEYRKKSLKNPIPLSERTGVSFSLGHTATLWVGG
jgi:hypothetical protein